MVVGTWLMDIPMAVGVQQMGDRLVAACTQYSGDDVDIEAIPPYQQKMTKRQWTGNRPMIVGTRRANFGPSAGINFYLKREQQMGKSLITASTQQIDFGLMVVSQWMAMSKVVAEQPTNTCP